MSKLGFPQSSSRQSHTRNLCRFHAGEGGASPPGCGNGPSTYCAGAGCADHVGHGDAAMLADVVDDLDGHFGRAAITSRSLSTLSPAGPFLLLQARKKKI